MIAKKGSVLSSTRKNRLGETEVIDLKSIIRNVPDFPKKGIMFRDITTLVNDGNAFRQVVDDFARLYGNTGVTKVVGIESRGFIFGAPLAERLGCGFVPVRKPGKLPAKVITQEYSLEYGTDSVQVHTDAIAAGEKVVMIDDLLATGGTMSAACKLVERLNGSILGVGFVVELSFLHGRKKLDTYNVQSLVSYDSE